MDIVSEPTGAVYDALLALARRHCPTFSLVWRAGGVRFGPGAEEVASELAPAFEREARASRWPGTDLLGDAPALVRYYRLTDAALGVLRAAGGLYAWRAPERPEDLALYGPDGAVWLGSVAHERDAFFGLAAPSAAAIRAAVPGLWVRGGKAAPAARGA